MNIFAFLIFVTVILIVAIKLVGKENLKKLFTESLVNSPFRRKNRVMNASEQALYINLQKNLLDTFLVLSKVRIEDFVEVKSGIAKNERFGLRNKIKSRHVDFLVCDLTTTKPILAIELDGASHNNYNQIERDNFVNGLYKDIGLRVEHIHVGSNFSEEAIRLRNILLQAANSPACPPEEGIGEKEY